MGLQLILLIIFIILSAIFLYVAYVQYNKVKTLTDAYVELANDIDDERSSMYTLLSDIANQHVRMYARIKNVDKGGSFESDDEIGFVFTVIKNTVKSLTVALSKLAKDLDLEIENKGVSDELIREAEDIDG